MTTEDHFILFLNSKHLSNITHCNCCSGTYVFLCVESFCRSNSLYIIEVAGYFENIGKAKQNSFFKNWIKCTSMRLILASTSLFQKTAKWNWLLLWNYSIGFISWLRFLWTLLNIRFHWFFLMTLNFPLQNWSINFQ